MLAADAAAGQRPVAGNCDAVLRDADFASHDLDFDDAAPGAVGNGIEVAVEGDHAVIGDAPLQRQQAAEGSLRQGLQGGLFLSEVFRDDAARGTVDADVGDRLQLAVCRTRVCVVW